MSYYIKLSGLKRKVNNVHVKPNSLPPLKKPRQTLKPNAQQYVDSESISQLSSDESNTSQKCRKLGIKYYAQVSSESKTQQYNRMKRNMKNISSIEQKLKAHADQFPDPPPLSNDAHFNLVMDCIRGFEVHEFITARPLEYYRKFLERDVRPDGRSLEECRPTLINLRCINTAEGSAIVKVGNTTVMCGIKAEITTPKAEEPKKGFIVPNIELSPLCSPSFKSGPPGEQAQVLSQFVSDVIKHSECIDYEELCILPGKYVWVLYCDMVCLDYDGNVGDASVLSLLAAFKNTSLPKVTWNEEDDKLEVDPDQKCPLNIHSHPVSSTFIVFDNDILLVDPTVEEEGLSTGEITIVTTESEICIVRKPGGTPLSPEQMSVCIDRAFYRNRQVTQLIQETLESIDR